MPEINVEIVKLASLRLDDEDLQMRESDVKGHQLKVVEDHHADLLSLFDEKNPIWPAALPPGEGVWDGKDIWVWDGWHRYGAAWQAGCVNVPIRVRNGTRTDAAWLACSANRAHGLRRTREDKARAIQAAIAIKPGLPARNYALHIGVDPKTVIEWIKENGLEKGFPTLAKKTTSLVHFVEFHKVDKEGSKSECFELPEAPEASPDENCGGSTSLPETKAEEEGGHSGESDRAAAATATNDGACFGLDEIGKPILSEASAAAFEASGLLSTARYHINEMAKLIDRIGKAPGGELLRSNYLKLTCKAVGGKQVETLHSHDLENLRRELDHWRPYAANCPKCKGQPKNGCKVCQGLPYLTKSAWERQG